MTTAPTATPAAVTDAVTAPLQPLLNDAIIVLRAPTQVWSDATGDMGAAAVHGVYHGDVRHVRSLALVCDGSPVEWISTAPDGASRLVLGGLLRDSTTPRPTRRCGCCATGASPTEWSARPGRCTRASTDRSRRPCGSRCRPSSRSSTR